MVHRRRRMAFIGLMLAAAMPGSPAAQAAQPKEPASQPLAPKVDRSTYIHHWVAMPSFSARLVPSLDKVTIKPVVGRIEVLVFLASWNVTTLRIAPKLAELDKRYAPYGVDFVYAFSHDQLADIRGFLKEFPLSGRKVLANQKLIATHMQPKIPTILVADKHGWLTYRTSTFTKATFEDLETILATLSGL